MATTVTLDELRELASFRAAKGCAVSLYLNLDPSVTPTAGDVATRLNSLVTYLSRHVDDATLVERRKSLRVDIERIRQFVDDQLDRDGAHGVAIFASAGDNLWRTLTIADAVPDIAKVNSELYIAPLVPLVGRSEGAIVAVVSRERGELYRLRGGRLEELADRSEPAPNQHDQGGWSQARYQRHVEHLVHAHLVRVADELERRVRRSGGPVVMVGTEETRAAFERTLSPEARAAIVGWAAAEAHAGPPELLAAALPELERWRETEEERTLDRWREEAGRQGRAAAGWEPTLEAASDGRVALLLFSNGVQHAAWRCPKCGRVAAHDGSCPLDGTKMEQSEDGLDLAVHQTLSNGGAVRAVTARRDLDPVEGIGALLRY
jgi:peptide chain release factor subunit 1